MKQAYLSFEEDLIRCPLPAPNSSLHLKEMDVKSKSHRYYIDDDLLAYLQFLLLLLLEMLFFTKKKTEAPCLFANLITGICDFTQRMLEDDSGVRPNFKPNSGTCWFVFIAKNLRYRLYRRAIAQTNPFFPTTFQQTLIMHGATCSILLCTFII